MKTTLHKLNMARSNLHATANLIDSVNAGDLDEGDQLAEELRHSLRLLDREITYVEAIIADEERGAA